MKMAIKKAAVDIGALVRERREARGLSYVKLAVATDLSIATLYRVECGGPITYRTAARIAPHLGVDVMTLLAGARS